MKEARECATKIFDIYPSLGSSGFGIIESIIAKHMAKREARLREELKSSKEIQLAEKKILVKEISKNSRLVEALGILLSFHESVGSPSTAAPCEMARDALAEAGKE